jgi:hypothetical protein
MSVVEAPRPAMAVVRARFIAPGSVAQFFYNAQQSTGTRGGGSLLKEA